MRSFVKSVSLEAIFHRKIRFVYATPTEKGQRVLPDTMRDVRHKGTNRSCVSVLRVTVPAASMWERAQASCRASRRTRGDVTVIRAKSRKSRLAFGNVSPQGSICLWYANRKGTARAVPFLLAYHEGFVRSTKCDGIAKTAQLICEQSRAGAVERQPRVRIPQGKKKGTERVRCLWRTMRDSNPRPSGP